MSTKKRPNLTKSDQRSQSGEPPKPLNEVQMKYAEELGKLIDQRDGAMMKNQILENRILGLEHRIKSLESKCIHLDLKSQVLREILNDNLRFYTKNYVKKETSIGAFESMNPHLTDHAGAVGKLFFIEESECDQSGSEDKCESHD